MKQILIENTTIVSMNASRDMYENGAILIEDHIIKAIGKIDAGLICDDCERIDGKDKIILPGLINTHVHLNQQLGRGLGDDVDLLTWLRDRIWPYESNLDYEDAYVSALACCSELIRSGVTTFMEAGGQHVDAMAKAVEEIGIRSTLCQSTMDSGEGLPKKWIASTEDCLNLQLDHLKNYHNTADGRIKVWFGLRTIFNTTDALITQTKALADQHKVGVNMHVAEIPDEIDYVKSTRGTSTVEHLNHLGVLDDNVLAVHCVWLTDREIDLFRLHNVKVSHNPGAAMRVLGFPRIPEMVHRGVTVALGTDGAPTNNRMNLIDELHLASLIHKGRLLDSTIMPAETILAMATINGAKAMLLDKEIGSLEVGKKADLIIINPDSVETLPLHDFVSNLVYALNSSQVESSMINGQWVMKNRQLLNIDEKALIKSIKEKSRAVVKRAGIEIPKRFPMIDCSK